jgi:hypothetical protein
MAIKTKPTNQDPHEYLSTITPEQKREDSLELLKLFEEITGEKAVIWGDSIIGFGQYHYKYQSGQSGDWFLAGFAPRKAYLTIYICPGLAKHKSQLAKLGKHKSSVGCIYLKKLSDIDLKVLKKIITDSVDDLHQQYNTKKA